MKTRNETGQTLIALSQALSKHWGDLPIDVCTAWEAYENSLSDGEFRNQLRDSE